ncbi:hypothetical protein BC940DRAFT_154282 [Gongronella butleri]|nr:hypothetical protein BC940DRAFT_154282 [Gongronella butleri]
MIKKLREQCRCSKVFVTPSCLTSSGVLKQDNKKRSPVPADVCYHAGGAQASTRPTRLVVRDFAGLPHEIRPSRPRGGLFTENSTRSLQNSTAFTAFGRRFI